MSERNLASGTDGTCAAAHDWIKQTAATGKALRSDHERPADGQDLVGALLPVVPPEHITAILAHHIRQTLSIPEPGPARGIAAGVHGTLSFADPYSARCPDCDSQTGAAAHARKLLGRWAE